MRYAIRVISAAVLVALWAADVRAQNADLQIVAPLHAGSCAIVVTSTQPLAANHLVQLRLSGAELPARPPTSSDRKLTAFGLRGPLREDDWVEVREVVPTVDSKFGGRVTVDKGDGTVECRRIKLETDDTRPPFEATAYLGRVFDNFSPSSIGHYAQSAPKTENNRAIYGIDFGGRLWKSAGGDRQLWIFGETLNGVRSADVDCRDRPVEEGQPPKPPACDQFSGIPGNTTNAVENAVYITQHATSLEAYVEPRFEFLTLTAGEDNRAVLYVRAVLGAMMVDDGTDHAASAHDIGGGVAITKGPFLGSHLSGGWGRTDLFVPTGGDEDAPQKTQRGRWNRLKIDGYLSFNPAQMFSSLPFVNKVPRIFVQLYTDFDPRGTDADSIQTFMGMELNIAEFFK